MNLIGRAIPLLNKLVPSALAIKGLSKIDNRLGTFIQNSLASGYTTDNVLDFLRKSIQSPGDRKEMQHLESLSESGNIHPEQQRSLQNRQGQEAIGKGIAGIAGLGGGLAGMEKEKGLPPIPSTGEIEKKLSIPKEDRNIIEQESPELYQFILDQIREGHKPIQAGAVATTHKKFSNAIKKLMKTHKIPWSNIIESVFGAGDQALPKVAENSGQLQQGQGSQALMAMLQKINQRLGQ